MNKFEVELYSEYVYKIEDHVHFGNGVTLAAVELLQIDSFAIFNTIDKTITIKPDDNTDIDFFPFVIRVRNAAGEIYNLHNVVKVVKAEVIEEIVELEI